MAMNKAPANTCGEHRICEKGPQLTRQAMPAMPITCQCLMNCGATISQAEMTVKTNLYYPPSHPHSAECLSQYLQTILTPVGSGLRAIGPILPWY